MRKRIVPIAVWRALLAVLSKSAVLAGNGTGYDLHHYQRDRDYAFPALDAALRVQVDEVIHALLWVRGDHSIGQALGALQTSLDPHRRPRFTGPRAEEEEEAARTGEAARTAGRLAARLREIAGILDAVQTGLGLRADDHNTDQAVTDRLNGMR